MGPGDGYAPRLHRVVPGWGVNTQPVSAVLEGENFLPVATQHLGGPEPVTMESRFDVYLGERRLPDVTWEDAHTLRLQIPEGLAPGWYPLEVETPLGERVELPRAYYVSERPPSSLKASATWTRERLWVGEETRLLLTVENTGGTRARAVHPELRVEGPGREVKLRPESSPSEVEPGASVSFAWKVEARTPGASLWRLNVQGEDEASGERLPVLSMETGLEVRERPELTASLQVRPEVANVGQKVRVTLHVDNAGPSLVRDVRPEVPVIEGSGGIEGGSSTSAPESVDVPPGEGRDFEWTYVASRTGAVNVRVGAGGFDDFTGGGVRSEEMRAPPLFVQTPGRLVAAFTHVPVNVNAGEFFLVDLEVVNLGDSPVFGVTLDRASASGSGGVTLVSGPEPTSVDIPGKGRVVFRARLVARQRGTCVFRVGARGVDQTDGERVSSPSIDSPLVNITR
ncbi:hypothetical protein MEBOL_006264 [Melittangium boletus DSM 14713]|uniref:DUF11 domain-containing protein n=2 Tax=Melittangium boletus TaxID=83453 RepID=A0A250ILZ0_9BACT|nr:hypothetical protein MEBOL_006264 [Melittangium boletus DSM 14713]